MMAYITDGRIVKNFSLAEMTNKQAKDEVKLILTPEVIEFAQMMQELRNWYGKPMNVSSWYRTKSFNSGLKGSSPNSAHLDGRACDINNIPQNLFDDFTIAWQMICTLHGKIGGVNYYSWGMHFTDHEDKFGHKAFQIRDKR
ncbi:MAG: hypothetical protein GX915_05100 [Clostridiales bacterium]|nr:hypothetical protein [Clostridiales bacterium]